MCLFCKIINKEIPSYVVYEDDDVLAFLDIYPCTKGHTLLIPKKHYENIFDIPENELKKIIVVSKKIAEILRDKLGAQGINLLNSSAEVAQQEIKHFHMHIIPRYEQNNCQIKFIDKTLEKNFDSIIQEINN